MPRHAARLVRGVRRHRWPSRTSASAARAAHQGAALHDPRSLAAATTASWVISNSHAGALQVNLMMEFNSPSRADHRRRNTRFGQCRSSVSMSAKSSRADPGSESPTNGFEAISGGRLTSSVLRLGALSSHALCVRFQRALQVRVARVEPPLGAAPAVGVGIARPKPFDGPTNCSARVRAILHDVGGRIRRLRPKREASPTNLSLVGTLLTRLAIVCTMPPALRYAARRPRGVQMRQVQPARRSHPDGYICILLRRIAASDVRDLLPVASRTRTPGRLLGSALAAMESSRTIVPFGAMRIRWACLRKLVTSAGWHAHGVSPPRPLAIRPDTAINVLATIINEALSVSRPADG